MEDFEEIFDTIIYLDEVDDNTVSGYVKHNTYYPNAFEGWFKEKITDYNKIV